MDPRRPAAVAAGGMLGASTRWAVLATVTATGRLPWPVLAVNVAGSVLLGVLLAEEWQHPRSRLLLHDFGGIGFCGGFTTFSTFSVDAVQLVRGDELALAMTYVAVSIALCLAGIVAGAAALRRVRAITLPLEERS